MSVQMLLRQFSNVPSSWKSTVTVGVDANGKFVMVIFALLLNPGSSVVLTNTLLLFMRIVWLRFLVVVPHPVGQTVVLYCIEPFVSLIVKLLIVVKVYAEIVLRSCLSSRNLLMVVARISLSDGP